MKGKLVHITAGLSEEKKIWSRLFWKLQVLDGKFVFQWRLEHYQKEKKYIDDNWAVLQVFSSKK